MKGGYIGEDLRDYSRGYWAGCFEFRASVSISLIKGALGGVDIDVPPAI